MQEESPPGRNSEGLLYELDLSILYHQSRARVTCRRFLDGQLCDYVGIYD